MFFYIALCLFVFITTFSYSFTKDKYLAFNLKIFAFLLLFIPAAIRSGIGTDYKSYVQIFNNVKAGKLIGQEYGWELMNLFVAETSLSAQWVFVISSFLTYIFLFTTKKKDFWIVLLLYFLYMYTTSYNAVRNAISITLFWASYTKLLKGHRLQGFFFVIFACLFHASAYLYIPVYLLMCFGNFNKKVTIVLGLIFYVLFTKFRFAQIIFDSALFGSTKYAVYVLSEQYGADAEITTGLGILLRQFYMFFIYFLCDEKHCAKKEFSAISILFLMALCSDVLSTQIVIFSRLRDCFLVAYMAIFAHLFRTKSRNAFVQVGKLGALCYPILFIFLMGLSANYNEVIPYTHIF